MSRRKPKLFERLADLAADPPGEWVPLEKYQQLQAVLNDALEENGERMWRERCEKALEMLRSSDSWEVDHGVIHSITRTAPIRAILEGREPLPAHPPRWAPPIDNNVALTLKQIQRAAGDDE